MPPAQITLDTEAEVELPNINTALLLGNSKNKCARGDMVRFKCRIAGQEELVDGRFLGTVRLTEDPNEVPKLVIIVWWSTGHISTRWADAPDVVSCQSWEVSAGRLAEWLFTDAFMKTPAEVVSEAGMYTGEELLKIAIKSAQENGGQIALGRRTIQLRQRPNPGGEAAPDADDDSDEDTESDSDDE